MTSIAERSIGDVGAADEPAAQASPEPLTIVSEKKPKAEKKAAAEAEKKPAAAADAATISL